MTPLNTQTKGAFTPNLFGAVQTSSGVFVHFVQFAYAGVKAVKLYRDGLEGGGSQSALNQTLVQFVFESKADQPQDFATVDSK